MSYFEIGAFNPKTKDNVGTLWRSAYQLGAAGIFTIGQRYKRQPTDTYRTPRHVPLREYATFENFLQAIPQGARLVCIEMGGTPLSQFHHSKQAIYLLGAEGYGLPSAVLGQCDYVVSLEAVGPLSYNVAVAGSIVMYHRLFHQDCGHHPTPPNHQSKTR